MINEKLRNRLRGCVVGAAVGDALGMPLEFQPRQPVDELIIEMYDGRIPAGTFTDDTEMALAFAHSLLSSRPLDPDDLATRFVAWFNAGPADVGFHTANVLRHIISGQTWSEAVDAVQSLKPDSAGNGSLMRAWPAAIAYHRDLEQLLRDSYLQSRITHPHPDCLNACAYLNAVLYAVFHNQPIRSALSSAFDHVDLIDDFRQAVVSAPFRSRSDLMNSGWVRHTLETAIWAVVNFDSFEESVVQAVNLGNDADTSGTVAGALAGAYYGLDAIPARWRSAIRGEYPLGSGYSWDVHRLIDLADQLADDT